MGVLLDFPSELQSTQATVVSEIDQLYFRTEEVRGRVKEAALEVIEGYREVPPFSFDLDLPPGLSPEEAQALKGQIQQEISSYTSRIHRHMIWKILKLPLEKILGDVERKLRL